jgi:hypothetical protein
MKIFFVVLLVCGVIGGFIGGEISHKTFSPIGALVGIVATAATVFLLGKYFHDQAASRPQSDLPPEMRAVFKRMTTAPASQAIPGNQKPAKPETHVLERLVGLAKGTLQVQLSFRYKQPHEAFHALVTNKKAAGYLFGYHDAMAQRVLRITAETRALGAQFIERSYGNIFGVENGVDLLNQSLNLQENSEFIEGRHMGGSEYVAFAERKVPPLGLSTILAEGHTEWSAKQINQATNTLLELIENLASRFLTEMRRQGLNAEHLDPLSQWAMHPASTAHRYGYCLVAIAMRANARLAPCALGLRTIIIQRQISSLAEDVKYFQEDIAKTVGLTTTATVEQDDLQAITSLTATEMESCNGIIDSAVDYLNEGDARVFDLLYQHIQPAFGEKCSPDVAAKRYNTITQALFMEAMTTCEASIENIDRQSPT